MPHALQAIWILFLIPILWVSGNVEGVNDGGDSRRIIHFAGQDWQVKAGLGLGPGNNNWSDSPESIWVDREGRLHLRIRQEEGVWYSAQVISTQPTQMGLHRFFVQTSLDDLDENVVLGLFLYQDDDHEIDVEFMRRTAGMNTVYVVQPYFHPGNRHPFLWHWPGPSTHDIDWQSDAITFRSIRGHDPQVETIMHLWRYEGASIPTTQDRLRIQINLWLLDLSIQTQDVEVVIADFSTSASKHS